MISKKRLLTIVSLLVVVAFLNTGIFGTLSDTERSLNNSATAYTPKLWKSTTEFDFDNNTTQVSVAVHSSPGNVTLAEKIDAKTALFATAGGNTKGFYRYSILNNTWTTKAPTLTNVGWGGSMAYNETGDIYALAGGGSNVFMRYNVTNDVWTYRAPTPGPVTSGSYLRYYDDDRMFYALQGALTGTMWKYNPATNVWTTLTTTLPVTTETDQTKNSASMIGYNGYMYVIRTDKADVNVFYRMSLTSPYAWTALNTGAPFNKDVKVGTSITHGQGGYLFASRGGSPDMYVYSIAQNKWTVKLAKPGFNLDAGSDLAFDNLQLYVTRGGGNTAMKKYNEAARTWTTLATTPGGISHGGNLLFVHSINHLYASNGTLYSKVFDTGSSQSVFNSLFADKAPKPLTNMEFWVRSANSRTWIPAPDDPNNGTGINGTYVITGTWIKVTTTMPVVIGRFMQWKVEMTTSDVRVSPILQEVRFYYRGV